MIIIYFQKMFHLYILEQSRSCRPASHVHSPVEVSHSPALLQSPGQVNSREKILYEIELELEFVFEFEFEFEVEFEVEVEFEFIVFKLTS